MVHKCVRCGAIYDDDAEELIKGCSVCGGRYFIYMREDKRKKSISKEEMKEIEKDIKEIIKKSNIPKEKTIIVNFTSIEVEKPGKYKLDLVNLFNQKAIVIKVDEGKYYIDFSKLESVK